MVGEEKRKIREMVEVKDDEETRGVRKETAEYNKYGREKKVRQKSCKRQEEDEEEGVG